MKKIYYFQVNSQKLGIPDKDFYDPFKHNKRFMIEHEILKVQNRYNETKYEENFEPIYYYFTKNFSDLMGLIDIRVLEFEMKENNEQNNNIYCYFIWEYNSFKVLEIECDIKIVDQKRKEGCEYFLFDVDKDFILKLDNGKCVIENCDNCKESLEIEIFWDNIIVPQKIEKEHCCGHRKKGKKKKIPDI